MGRGIVKLEEDQYVEWSSVVDAPVSYVMSRTEAVAELGGEERVARADQNGTSFVDETETSAADYVSYNRAGPGESQLSMAEIIKQYQPPK